MQFFLVKCKLLMISLTRKLVKAILLSVFDISFLPYSTLFNWLTGRVSDNFFCKSMKFIYRMKERECVIAAVVLL